MVIILIICILLIFLLWIVYSLTIKYKQTKNNQMLIRQAKRDQIKSEIEEIKMIQLNPKF